MFRLYYRVICIYLFQELHVAQQTPVQGEGGARCWLWDWHSLHVRRESWSIQGQTMAPNILTENPFQARHRDLYINQSINRGFEHYKIQNWLLVFILYSNVHNLLNSNVVP